MAEAETELCRIAVANHDNESAPRQRSLTTAESIHNTPYDNICILIQPSNRRSFTSSVASFRSILVDLHIQSEGFLWLRFRYNRR